MQKSDYVLRKEIIISNIVCTADLKQPVDISSFNKYKFLSSNLNLYRCGYIKNNTMIGKVVVFGSGKLISIGTKKTDQAFSDLEKASSLLKKYKMISSYKLEPKIQNIVSKVSLGRTINLDRLAKALPRCIYEPEQFPGIIYKDVGSVTVLIFNSGKMVIVGAKNTEELNRAFFDVIEWITKIL